MVYNTVSVSLGYCWGLAIKFTDMCLSIIYIFVCDIDKSIVLIKNKINGYSLKSVGRSIRSMNFLLIRKNTLGE